MNYIYIALNAYTQVFRSVFKPAEDGTPGLREVLLDAELKYTVEYYALVILVAIFGASVSFPLIITPVIEPANASNLSTVRTLLAVSWTLFVTGALLACYSAGTFYSKGYMKAIEDAK